MNSVNVLHDGPEGQPDSGEIISSNQVALLLSGVARAARSSSSLEQLRVCTLNLLCECLHANSAFWAWGHAGADRSMIQPLAILSVGYDQNQKAILAQMGLDPVMSDTYRRPILKMMGNRKQITIVRRQLFSDESWLASKIQHYQFQIGMDSWIQAVRYENPEAWSNVFVSRCVGQPEFDASEACLLNVALEALPWLHATTEPHSTDSSDPPLHELTDRQRVVLHLLLDGLSRKMIASKLGICEDTVGDHIKAIYRHFDVASLAELAARFLRNH